MNMAHQESMGLSPTPSKQEKNILFITSLEQRAKIFEIAISMFKSDLPENFVQDLVSLHENEGIYDLMVMWAEETDDKEKEEIIADLQEDIKNFQESGISPEEKLYLNFDDLDEIAKDVIAFKKGLLSEVNKKGGISKLSRESSIPQPSLSRFFNSASMPRQTTLYKIAKALNLSEIAVRSKWVQN